MNITVTKEISTDENSTEAFVETCWWCVNSSPRVTLMFRGAVHLHCLWGNWEGLIWIALRPTLRKENSSRMLRVAVQYQCLSGIWEGFLWIELRPTLINEISSVYNVKESFWETSFWSVSSSHRVTTSASRSSLLTLFSWNLQSDIWEATLAHGDKGNILT